jgi:benzoyl-CoA reductase subunit D
MITAGIDCGSKNTKSIIIKDERILGKAMVLTGFDQEKAINDSFEAACRAAGVTEKDVQKIGGTGSGRNSIKGSILINDVQAMCKAARFLFPGSKIVADIGAEEGRAAKFDEKGNPVDFAINERCAAGAGSFIEAMSRVLEISIEEIGPLALTSGNDIPMNAQCTIFAETEVVGLIHANTPKNDISRAIHDAIAGRIVSMIRRVGVDEEIVIMGGMAYNPAFLKALKTQLNIDDIKIPDDPEYGAAIGAAVAASE